jgi:CysZ protein
MINAAIKALGDVLSKDLRSILWTAIALALGLFIAIFAGIEALFWAFTFVRWPWLEAILAVGAGFGLLVAFFFLMAPVTSLFAGFYLDRVAALVERRHYPNDRPGEPLSGWTAIATSLQFAGLVLVANLFALPLIFTGIGIFALFAVNAYLISREYFEMTAMRHMPPVHAKALRQSNALRVFIAGLLPAGLALVPVLNLIVPLFSTSYFVHIVKRVLKS